MEPFLFCGHIHQTLMEGSPDTYVIFLNLYGIFSSGYKRVY